MMILQKKIYWFLVILVWGFAGLLPAHAAQPFKAPVLFDLSGSSMNMAINFDLGNLGDYDLKLHPNPAPVTGFIDVDTISTLTGICSGRMRNISASTEAEIEKGRLNLDFTITAILNADPLEGIFIWNKNKAVFYPDNLVLTLKFDSESWDIPLSGIPLPAEYNNGVLSLDINLEYSDEYAGYEFSTVIGLHLRGTLQSQGSGDGQLVIDLALDKNVYQPGDRLQLRAGLNNGGGERQVDIYVAFFDQEGNYFFAPEYTNSMTPLTRLNLEADQYTALSRILDVHLPSHSPPIAAAGACSFYAVVTLAGSREPISNLACADFTYNTTINNSDPFAGEWHGSGASSVPGGECPPLATVHMTIVNGQISGVADEVVTIDADDYRMTGTIDDNGKVIDGILLEEFMNSWIPVGSYTGTFSETSCSGTWMDEYGCYGTYTLEKMNQE